MPTFPVETLDAGFTDVLFKPAIMALKTLMDNRCRSERAVERLSGIGRQAVAWSIGLSLACGAISPGCSSSKKFHAGRGAGQQTASEFLSQLVRSDVTHSECAPDYQEAYGPMDIDIATLSPEQMHGLTLQDCIALGVSNSKLMRDLGVTVLRTPQSLASTLDPAVVYTDPRMGEEAALSAFDDAVRSFQAIGYRGVVHITRRQDIRPQQPAVEPLWGLHLGHVLGGSGASTADARSGL